MFSRKSDIHRHLKWSYLAYFYLKIYQNLFVTWLAALLRPLAGLRGETRKGKKRGERKWRGETKRPLAQRLRFGWSIAVITNSFTYLFTYLLKRGRLMDVGG